MNDSILDGTKKALGIESSYTQFDPEIIMYINSAFGTLHQLGIGPIQGFAIEDSTALWASFLSGDNRFNAAKQYVYMKVRLVFDPPSTSFVIDSMTKSIQELEFRLNLVREGVVYGLPVFPVDPPVITPPVDEDVYLDGGSPSQTSYDNVYDGGTP